MLVSMADVENIVGMINVIKQQERLQVIREINAFASEYHHHINGRDVVIVEQLLDFLGSKSEPTNNE